eukprot:26754-Pyramimonas_sp.AAC.1
MSLNRRRPPLAQQILATSRFPLPSRHWLGRVRRRCTRRAPRASWRLRTLARCGKSAARTTTARRARCGP